MSGKGKGKRSSATLSPNGHNGSPKHVKTDCDSYSLSSKVLEKTESIKQAWGVQDKEIDDGSILLVNEPFTCCSIKDILSSKKSVEALVTECADLEFVEKNNDLYKFKQSSSDLQSSVAPGIVGLRNFLLGEVRPWLEGVTGIKLDEDRVAMFCARYDYTDYLLCHDDELEGRRIAYILYLVPNSWEEADGGSLDQFDTLPNGHPNKVLQELF